jgi:hypothetical protein
LPLPLVFAYPGPASERVHPGSGVSPIGHMRVGEACPFLEVSPMCVEDAQAYGSSTRTLTRTYGPCFGLNDTGSGCIRPVIRRVDQKRPAFYSVCLFQHVSIRVFYVSFNSSVVKYQSSAY